MPVGTYVRGLTVEQRFWQYVDKGGPVHSTLGQCWQWTGPKTEDEGYGSYGLLNVGRKSIRAHRYAYGLFIESVPEGLTVDHLCRNRLCVNPEHLEPVTNKVNILRGESPAAKQARQEVCKNGHPLIGDNVTVYEYKGGTKRVCRTCKKARNNARGPNRRKQKCVRCGKLKEGGIRGLRLCNSCRGAA